MIMTSNKLTQTVFTFALTKNGRITGKKTEKKKKASKAKIAPGVMKVRREGGVAEIAWLGGEMTRNTAK